MTNMFADSSGQIIYESNRATRILSIRRGYVKYGLSSHHCLRCVVCSVALLLTEMFFFIVLAIKISQLQSDLDSLQEKVDRGSEVIAIQFVRF